MKRTDARPLKDFSMWAMLQSGGQKPNVPLLRQLIRDWITMATQKDAGQRKNSKGISFDNVERVRMGILCEAVALELSGVLAKLEEEEK